MNDVLPDQVHLWEFFEQVVRDWMAEYGYRNIRMPIVEQTDLFVRSIGAITDIVEKEMYSFVDSLNGDSLALRPEGTASCVRAVLEHNLLYSGPQRLYYSGPMFRHERPQKGRYRQFYQVGAEALGYAGPDIDAELIVMCAELWKKLGIFDVRLEIGTLGSTESRAGAPGISAGRIILRPVSHRSSFIRRPSRCCGDGRRPARCRGYPSTVWP